MSESQPSRVVMFDNSDPEMQRAYESARASFRYFWREIAWERRRIVPALDLVCVKEGDSARIPLKQISDWMYAIDGEVYGAYTVNLLRSRMGRQAYTQEHPMSEGKASKLKEQLTDNPSLVHTKDDRGWTFLHQEALAGNTATVQVLLEAGADRNVVTNHGMTALQLAQSLGWDRVVELL